MYCPRCSTLNNLDQKFCRQCGLPFAALRVALAGNYDDAIEKLKKGENALGGGVLTLCIFIVVAIANVLLSYFFDFTPNYITALINLILGLVFGLPAMMIGLKRIRISKSLLEDQNATPHLQSEEPVIQLPKAAITDRSISAPPVPDSVTEHTTMDLKPPEHAR